MSVHDLLCMALLARVAFQYFHYYAAWGFTGQCTDTLGV